MNQSLICIKTFLYMKHGTWLDKEATVDSSGCWTKGGKYVAPESLLPYWLNKYTGLGHSGPATMNHRFSNQWWNPKFRNAATETVKRCVTCQKNNDVPAATPAAHTPAPPGPFRHLQVDYISLPPCKKNWRFGSNRQVLKMGRSLSNRALLQLHILLNVLSLISFPDGDYQIALTQIKVPTSQDR